MSEYGLDMDDSPPQQQPLGGSETPLHLSFDDPTNAANNSIIGKVKSRVSSIFPNRISKWFSPSTKSQNDELNGGVAPTNVARRRRRIEVEEDEDDENYDGDEIRRRGEYEENHNLISKQEENSEVEDDEEDDDDASQNSEEEYNATLAAQKTRHDLHGRQPPAKRSRLNVDMRDSPLIAPRRPLIASTPAVGSTYLRNSIGTASVSRSSYQRFTNLNLYANQNKKEPAYNFSQQKDSASPKINTDIIDLISNPPNEVDVNFVAQSNVYSRPGISSRRSLNIPSSSSTRQEAGRVIATVGQLKRQSMATAKTDLESGCVPPRRTSTTIHEVKDSEENHECDEQERDTTGINMLKYNGQVTEEVPNAYKRVKRPKHINGSGFNQPNDIPEANEAILLDTASESGESGTAELTKSQIPQRKTGLFNTSVAGTGIGTTRNSSRTSSFGNGLNFYSHLEGRKSLFTGPGQGVSNPLNNSTLSLTSLNRRQFNASIYGSTSALSDSRLLNTFSPFYKGKTTYGGAAAYNKYTAGAGASAVRITPTLIRPTSSLSTLSSSNNSLATNTNSQHIGESSTISSTAKRILDLINDFATPLSEAKKMASSLKTNPNLQMSSQSMGRLNESDLNASRAMRLSQVRTPYSRPAVILQPSGNANGRGIMGGPMPPVKELQVPTMSQLLQMKKIQNTTEKARNITRKTTNINSESSEYTLPVVTSVEISKTPPGALESEQQLQLKHTNKIKNKVSNTLRTSAASKDLQDEAPPPSVNLPNIAFPLMQSVPKFDIKFSAASTVSPTASTSKSFVSSPTAFNTKMTTSTLPARPATDIKIVPDTPKASVFTGASTTSSTKVNFKFSEPLVVKGVNTPTQNITPTNLNNYKFSPPLEVTLSMTPKSVYPKPPQLKTGSCLDVLNKPISLPPPTPTTADAAPLSANSFGSQFKKSSNEWECEACMIRNKAAVSKCVACETPRRREDAKSSPSSLACNASLPALSPKFGQQFKKSSSEWECDTCMIRNKDGSTKCVACETPRKGVLGTSVAQNAALPPSKNSFGDYFRAKTGTWECSTCLINNKNEVTECVACQTKKPGCNSSEVSTAPTSSFKFGFSHAQAPSAATTSDAGFKTIAAQQKASKWECDACMTRNDAERTKCACCEQPKPGSTATESPASSSTKFTFGATSAAKFSFGFGPGSNAPKEDVLRKDNVLQPEEKKTSTTPAVITSNTSSGTSFQFGIKPIVSVTQEKKKDETDSKNNPSSVSSSATGGTSFKFGVPDTAINKPETSTKSSAIATTGFQFSPKSAESTLKVTSAKTSTTTANSPSINFSLPSTVTASSTTTSSAVVEKPTGIAAPTFSFGSNTASSTTDGFSFAAAKKPTVATEEKKALEGFAFKTPTAVSSSTANQIAAPTAGFVFGSTLSNKSPMSTITQTTTSSTTNNTSSPVSAATTAAVKPMFSFGSNTPASAAPATTTSGAGFGGFSFGSSSTPAVTAGKTLFGSVTSTSSTTTTTASSNSSTTPAATTNLFGSFGGTTSATPTFGSSPAATAYPANNSTTVSSSTNSTNNTTANTTPTFGSFGLMNPTTTNVFGSFGGSSQAMNQTQNKPVAPVFGNVALSSGSQPASPKTFVFGSAPNTAPVAAVASTASTTASVSSASTTWPKSNFVFGSVASTQAIQSVNANKDAPKPSVFGAFSGGGGATNSSNQQTTSIFGNPASASNITSPPPPAFGSTTTTTNASTNLFGVNSAPAPATNIFGANPSGNAVTPAPAFGSSPFGGSASSTSATPTFGSTAVTGSATFGGFGTVAGNTANVTETKKPEPAFNFGSAPATQQSTSGGFNFGSTSAPTKPAFNFGGSGGAPQPTFNFTGATESQSSTKPFQFGAIQTAPVFNFGGGAIEATPNAPFQFNAGTAAPVSSNIFAPAPTPGAQSAQQAKRKTRAPIRRVTQR